MIASYSAQTGELNEQQIVLLKQQRDAIEADLVAVKAQLADLAVKLDKRDAELNTTKNMYLEMCKEKNNLQEELSVALKAQFDVEYRALHDDFQKQIATKDGSFCFTLLLIQFFSLSLSLNKKDLNV